VSDNPPGWYRDPGEPTTQRYWDGEGWVGAPLPVDATPPDGPPADDTPVPPAAPSPPAPGSAPPAGAYPGYPGYPPGTYPPGMPPPGALPPGAYPPGAYPPGAFPPGAYPPGALPPGAYPPGALPPGAYPPGALPPAGVNAAPGSAPPATAPALPPGAKPPGGTGFPYAYGPYVLVPQPRPHGFALAPLSRRFAARMIDIVAVLLLNVLGNGVLVYRLAQEIRPFWNAVWSARNTGKAVDVQPDSRATWLLFAIFAVAMLIWAVYEVPSTGSTGQTLGKRLVHIKVMPLEGTQQLGFGRSLARWMPLGLPTLAWGCYGIGFIYQMIDCLSPAFNRPLHLALHDRRAATVVVSLDNPQPATSPTTTPQDDVPGGSR
jgi:RDD family/Protein of unknown function (DUF2510)